MSRISFLILLLAACCSNYAYGFCSDPSPPYRKPQKPSPPFCINEWTNTHTCEDWTIDLYYQELDAYQAEVNRYMRDLQTYVEEAVEYAECEIKELERGY